MKLCRDFYRRPTVLVARDLIGKKLNFYGYCGYITETEAYVGNGSDLACHAHRGVTKRTEIMFGPAGFSYVYLIYGLYHCLNIVTEEKGRGCAVLIRAIKDDSAEVINGPGKLCKRWGITRNHNGLDITHHPEFYVTDTKHKPEILVTPRIGISKSVDHPWRFVLKDPSHFPPCPEG